MSSVQQETKTLFKKAAERASLAPSIHNTQPWHFVIRPHALELYADSDRQLRALDPPVVRWSLAAAVHCLMPELVSPLIACCRWTGSGARHEAKLGCSADIAR
jgi:nitroreductase